MYVCMYVLQREKFNVSLVIPNEVFGNPGFLVVLSFDWVWVES